MIPVPICLQRLPRHQAPGSIVSLTPAEYWTLLLPGFEPGSSTLDLAAPDCSGRFTLGQAAAGGAKHAVHPDEMVIGSGADGFKIAWLPLGANGTKRTGLLALMRQKENFLEVYALGTHQGSLGDTRFTLERMGPALVVVAREEHCRGSEDERRCDAASTVYLAGNGRLSAQAHFPLDHTVESKGTATTVPSVYRFSASAEYRPDGIAITEKLSVTQKGRGEVSSVDLERTLRLQGGRLVPSGDSLWVQTARQLNVPED
ncbi:MAG TPA: hypothetical protein VG963_05115 [Polyangiaceae bacterium]|nr:hypothetical protein [Polyangiaceae bacterium]